MLMESGCFLSGRTDHYAIESYSDANGTLKAQMHVTQPDASQTIFGETKPEMALEPFGTSEPDGMTIGNVSPADDEAFDIQFFTCHDSPTSVGSACPPISD